MSNNLTVLIDTSKKCNVLLVGHNRERMLIVLWPGSSAHARYSVVVAVFLATSGIVGTRRPVATLLDLKTSS